MELIGHSKAGFSTWVYLPSLKMLLDAGEGANDSIGSRAIGLLEVLISHSHADHFAGLLALMAGRTVDRFGRGHDTPRLRICYPKGSIGLERFFDFLGRDTDGFDELVELQPMEPGQSVPCKARPELSIYAVKATHNPYDLCLSFRISQTRKRLKPEHNNLSKDELQKRIQSLGREAMHYEVSVPLLTYTGDSKPLEDKQSEGVELLIHEATFLGGDTTPVHSTLDEALAVARELQAKKTILLHFSARYDHPRIAHEVSLLPRPENLHLILPDQTALMQLMVPGLG
jgi:ribonuclease Z